MILMNQTFVRHWIIEKAAAFVYFSLVKFLRLFDRADGGGNSLAGFLFDFLYDDYRIKGCRFKIPKKLTTRSFRSRFFYKGYESREVFLVEKFIQPGDNVLELGACLGVISCLTNRKLSDPQKHVVVEANPHLIPWLAKNKAKNQCQFAIEHCLVSDTSDGEFFIHPLIVGGSANRQTGQKVQVPVKTLKALEEAYGFTFSALILDIEGGEHDFLVENAADLDHIKTIIVEFHDWIIGKEAIAICTDLLSSNGFHCAFKQQCVEVWQR